MTLAAGSKLGHYEIRSKLGEGGMGEVYLALDTKLGRKVALKILPAELASNQDRMRRFTQEAKAAAALNHANGATGEQYPDCSPEGRWVVYNTVFGKPTVWRVPAEGGAPVQLSDMAALRPAVSPDGKWIAFFNVEENSPLRIVIIPFEGGQPAKTLDVPQTISGGVRLRWIPDSRAVAYIDTREGVSNIWALPLDGGAPKQLTAFASDRIFWFDFSRDGKQLALSRGTVTSDVVLIKDFR